MNVLIDFNFKISLDGIHLIRSNYTYKKIFYNDIDKVVIGKGRAVNNWILILLIGIALFVILVFFSFLSLKGFILSDGNIRFLNVFGHMILMFLIMGGLGYYSIRNSLKIVPIIWVYVSGNIYKLRVIKTQDSIKDMIEIFSQKGIIVEEVAPLSTKR